MHHACNSIISVGLINGGLTEDVTVSSRLCSSKIASAKNKNKENVLQRIASDEAEAFVQGQAVTATSITFLGLAQSELSTLLF